jgi:hypothetical protein
MNYADTLAISTLLNRDPKEPVQLLYVRLNNGKTMAFVGAPLSEEDFEKLDDITFGECVDTGSLNMMRILASGTTAQ